MRKSETFTMINHYNKYNNQNFKYFIIYFKINGNIRDHERMYLPDRRAYLTKGSGILNSQTDGAVHQVRRPIVRTANVVHAQSSLTFSTPRGHKRTIFTLIAIARIK